MKSSEYHASSQPFTSYNWSCPLPFSFSSHSSSTTARDSWNAVISESQGQNRICSRRSHEASSSRLLNYFPLGENYSWAISILAEILALPVSLLRFPTLFIFLLPSPLLLFISLTNVVSRVISSYCLWKGPRLSASQSCLPKSLSCS